MNSKTKKPTTKTRQLVNNVSSKKSQQPREETFDARRLLVVPLIVLIIYSVYLIAHNLGGFTAIYQSPLEVFMFLPFPMVLITVFCCLAAYALIVGRPIGRLATGVAWILIVLIGWVILASLASAFPGSSPSKCEGLFGVQQNCADVGAFQAYVLLLNPFTLGFYSLLSIVGISTVMIRLKK